MDETVVPAEAGGGGSVTGTAEVTTVTWVGVDAGVDARVDARVDTEASATSVL
jgi:hypothetical protein